MPEARSSAESREGAARIVRETGKPIAQVMRKDFKWGWPSRLNSPTGWFFFFHVIPTSGGMSVSGQVSRVTCRRP